MREAAALHARAGDAWGLLLREENLGELELSAGRPAQAARHHEAAVQAARRIGHRYRLVYNLAFLGLAQRRLGQLPAARACLHESLRISLQHRLERPQADGCVILGSVLLDSGEPDRALALAQAAQALYQRHGLTPMPNMQAERKDVEAAASAQLSAHAAHAARACGEAWDLVELLRWAEGPGPASGGPPA